MGKGSGLRTSRYEVVLREKLSPDDKSWIFKVAHLPNRQRLLLHNKDNRTEDKNGGNGAKMSIMSISVTQEQSLVLRIEQVSINRVLIASAHCPEELIAISFANLEFPNTFPKTKSDYIERLLSDGIELNTHKYIFYGHSNSQLKSRTCYLLRASSGDVVMRKISEFGDFSKFMSTAKRAKRIGLLFSASEASIQLDNKFTADIDDVEADGNIFTDGCGMMSPEFAKELSWNRNIHFQNSRYIPGAFQIRYKGYKGMLMVNKDLKVKGKGQNSEVKAQFRASMKKFKDCPDNSFSILDYSKPFTYACLNGELVTLLSCLGIPDEIFIKKQNEYFEFLEKSAHDARTAFKYLCYKGEFGLAEEVLLSGLTRGLTTSIKRMSREEWHGTYKKNDVHEGNERVRIMIPASRILFGVCDYSGTLKEGECHVRITTESEGPRTILDGQVIVSRNPCLHPGDIRKFKPVRCDALAHLIDVIVFPIVGKRDPASLMSGGDLDGDKFFVSWDKEIIPAKLYEPYGYPPAKETPRREITYKNMVEYFARYNNASLGKVKNLYIEWCRSNPELGAGSRECQELNRLFSSCVDGERIKIPEHLESPPKPKENGEVRRFILDILCDNVKAHAERIFQQDVSSVELTTREVLESLISSSDMRMTSLRNEYELFLMTLKWARANGVCIGEFMNYFDFGAFTKVQKHCILATLTEESIWFDGLSEQYIGPIFNALHQSDLLSLDDLRSAKLDHPSIRWQKLYSSLDDDGLRLTSNLEKAFENFDKKMLIFEVEANLRVAVYIPKRIERDSPVDVGAYKKDLVKCFAFEPRSGRFFRQSAQDGFLLYFDGELFQLFHKKRPNTFIWFALNEGYAARNRIKAVGEFKVSIALQRFDPAWSRTHSKITKKESAGIEIYVISNRDRVGQDFMENVMNSVMTTEIVRNLENTPKDYCILEPPGTKIDWSERCVNIVKERKFQELKNVGTLEEFQEIFDYCLQLGEFGTTQLFEILNKMFTEFSTIKPGLRELILGLPAEIPTISTVIVQKLMESEGLVKLPEIDADFYYFSLAKALILSANELRESSLEKFMQLLDLMATNGGKFTLTDVVKLVKLILFTIRDSEFAQHFITELFSEEDGCSELFTMARPEEMTFELGQKSIDSNNQSENAICLAYFRKFLQALAADYLAEVKENCPCDFWGIPEGAEDVEILPVPVPSPSDPEAGSSKHHLNFAVTLAQFVPTKYLGTEDQEAAKAAEKKRQESSVSHRPEPKQKCIEIREGEKTGIFETILRSDTLSSSIRNEDHLRFCASKRSTNKSKQRITVFDAITISVTRGKLEFRILQKPLPPELFQASWNIYSCASTTNLSIMCTAVLNLINQKSIATAAYSDILELPQAGQPETNVDITLANNFNESQTTAVREALNNPLTLIWGPPGTGKTTVVVEIILNFLRIYPHFRILITASTHNAVDNVMERFLKERKEKGNPKDANSDDAVRLTSDFSKVGGNLKKWTLDAFVGANIQGDDKAKGAAAKKLKEATLIFSTCSGAGVGLLRSATDSEITLWPVEDPDGKKAKKKKKAEEKFDVVIVDEASQITEPNAIIPLLKGSKFVVLVGDHVQLRPTVTSEMAKDFGLDTSLFERLYTSQKIKASKVMLDVQYRMHPNLSQFSSTQFYGGKLLSGVLAENRMIPASKFPWPKKNGNSNFPFVFAPCASPENFGDSSKSNQGQARLVVHIVKMLRASEVKNTSIIILTPYTKQVALIKTELKSGGAAVNGVEVNTIDGFQGREADVIIFSTVRANRAQRLGFLDDKRRMNVAVTRARFGLIVVGHEETLGNDELWKNMIAYAAKVELKPEK